MSNSQMGCLICDKDLIYHTQPQRLTCSVCGNAYLSEVHCLDGHYVCDQCHSGDITDKIGRILNSSSEKDPVALAVSLFELPDLKMHGPEYHSIVPAVLVAAYQNLSGTRDLGQIIEALRRGKEIKGGSCGYNGNCGACVGSGIAASVLGHATPMSVDSRGLSNKVTGTALVAISGYRGPRCCKRESITAIETYMAVTGHFGSVTKSSYICRQSLKNKGCIGAKCPYFSRAN